ncbi:MAG: urate hydroxylase PuuD [Pseudomonadota bacterium]
MMTYALEWAALLGRWLHLIAGIAWIGSSFYFIWLDNHLEPPKSAQDRDDGVGGELWAVHGGGFYQSKKFAGAPPAMPETLHWFKWEAYTTWFSGLFLLALVYWVGAEVYLIDANVAALSQPAAVGIGIAYLVGGWIVYDGLCRSPLAKQPAVLSALLCVLLVGAAWSLCQLFSGRGAYIHYGALIGTIMVANVLMVIIPGQRRMVAAITAGTPINPADGLRGKQRSVHNTYLTLPVLFVMISNHYPMTFAHTWNWLLLIGMTVAGALIRVYFVARHKGAASPVPLIAAGLVLAAVAAASLPRTADDSPTTGAADLSAYGTGFQAVIGVIETRCAGCHAAVPTYPGFLSAPGGVMLDSADAVLRHADSIYQQSVASQAMPIGNLTNITDTERQLLGAWYAAGASADWRR